MLASVERHDHHGVAGGEDLVDRVDPFDIELGDRLDPLREILDALRYIRTRLTRDGGDNA